MVVNWFLLHFRPVRVPKRTLPFGHTFGLGGMSLVLVVLLSLTGLLMMFVYEPSPERAYLSVTALEAQVGFGGFVRGIHHWSANLLVVIVVLHLLRVFFTGGFRAPDRQFNWVIGLGLLLFVLASNFTGYLLPWDQLSYWAVTVSTGMLAYVPVAGPWLEEFVRGGPEVGRATLLIFYTLHTTLAPVALFGLMGFHFFRVRKARGVVVPRGPGEDPQPNPERVLSVPHLLLREASVALILIAGVLITAALVAAPLGEAANPGMSPNPAKAPWYFMGFQELLLHFHPVVAVFVIPFVAGAALLLLPYLDHDEGPAGIWFQSRNGRRTAALAGLLAAVAVPLWVVMDEFVLDWSALLPLLPPTAAEGVVPGLLAVCVLLAVFLGGRRFLGASRSEAVQSVFVFSLVAFMILTATGVWFRGPGMALTLPFTGG
jgi:quinol-cytochrome oxidoreductase complex cytochrome b subunit